MGKTSRVCVPCVHVAFKGDIRAVYAWESDPKAAALLLARVRDGVMRLQVETWDWRARRASAHERCGCCLTKGHASLVEFQA